MVRSLASAPNRAVLRSGLVEAMARRLQLEGTLVLEHLTIDLDLLPVDVEGGQQGACFHPYYGGKVYLPLVASVAETGDLLDVKLQHGTVHETENFGALMPALLDQVEGRIC